MIYFIRGKESGNIKIGFSMNPDKRKAHLQTAHYEELEFIGIMDGTLDDEAKIKERFLKFNIRGEWYSPVSDILNFVERYKKPRKNIVTSLGDGEYRITFAEPFKFTMNIILLLGNHNIRVLSDRDGEFIFGSEGKREILIWWLQSLKGVTQKAIDEFGALMAE